MPKDKLRPVPSKQQLEWQNMELGMFFHFDMSTFTGELFPSEPYPPEVFSPDSLDTDQWIEAACTVGAEYAVLTAKHCTGFQLWQSDAYPYGVKQSSWKNGRGDVVEDFVKSCRSRGIKPGLYISASSNSWWGVKDPGLVNQGKGGNPGLQQRYVKAYEQMFLELVSNYGELSELWFDGDVLHPEEGGPDILSLIRKYQPGAVCFKGPAPSIRWIGNENGTAGYPCWASVSSIHPGSEAENGTGDPDGDIWLPGECDTPFPGHDWLWSPGQKPGDHVIDTLMDIYYRSVGKNTNLLLNAAPDRSGRIPDDDMHYYRKFGKELKRRFEYPVGETRGTGSEIFLKLGKPEIIDHIVLMENIINGESVRRYRIELQLPNEQWATVCTGESMGHKRIERIKPAEVSELKLVVEESRGTADILSFAVFNAGI